MSPRFSLLLLVVLRCFAIHSSKVQRLCLDDTSTPPCDDELLVLLQNGAVVRSDRKADSPHASHQSSAKEIHAGDSWQTELQNMFTWGLVLGLLLIGPDHLGTLMALSTLTRGFAAFKVGFSWGIGHSVGMLLIVPLFFLLKKLSTKASADGDNGAISLENWEYWGDYFIGASMILISFYFVLYEHLFVERQEDGTYKMKTCGCCEQAALVTAESNGEEDEPPLGKICSSYGAASKALSKAKLKPRSSHRSSLVQETRWTGRDWKGAVLGILQGLCCPTGLLGLGFMGRVSSHASMSFLFAFAIVFVITSGLGSGFITVGWGYLSSNGLSSCISPRLMYLSSCAATGFLGLIWIVANAGGFLHHINYSEKLSSGMIQSHSS